MSELDLCSGCGTYPMFCQCEVPQQDPVEAGKKLAAPSDPMAVARQLLPNWLEHEHQTLRHWRGAWMRWERSCWGEVEEKEIRSTFYWHTENAVYTVWNAQTGEWEDKKWSPTKRKIADLLEATAAIVHLPASVNPPTWFEQVDDIPAGPIVACANGLLHVGQRQLLSLDPRFFNLVSVPFDYEPNAAEPGRWLEFLGQLWPDDKQSINVLQEWFGYVLSGRTDLHKILLTVGPTRSGKGTIARVLTAMVGKANMAGPTLASLATNFGLSPLLGKPLAIISDARLGGRDTHQVVERLLTISGEDTIDVDRKYRDPWTGKLPTRFLILSNELPNFGDASGTIANRFIVLSQQVSWLGKENPRLTEQLIEQLPGILNWALQGLDRLTGRGRFTEPASSRDSVIMMQDTSSPMSAFVRECCAAGPGHVVGVAALFAAWRQWCEDNGRHPGSLQMFGRNLRSVVPQVKVVKPHGGQRTYEGITLVDERWTNNWNDRGSSRFKPALEPLNRDEPRFTPFVASTSGATTQGAAFEEEL